MVDGEYAQTVSGRPELQCANEVMESSAVLGQLAAGRLADEDHSSYELSDAQRLEQLLCQPMEFDMSAAGEVTALFTRLPQGVYSVGKLTDRFLLADTKTQSRKLMHNMVRACGFALPLKGDEFYLHKPDEDSDIDVLERAEAVVDRIAELVEHTPNLSLDRALRQIHQERELLPSYASKFRMVEHIARRHLRLQTKPGKTDSDSECVVKVHPSIPDLPATVGESLQLLIDRMPPGATSTALQWFKRIRGPFQYTPDTLQAFQAAMQLDPRFILVRLPIEKNSSATYMIKPEEAMREPLLTAEDFCQTPVEELVDRALETCHPCDLQTKSQVLLNLTKGIVLPDETREAFWAALVQDPRVFATHNKHYVQILHSDRDRQLYDRFAEIVQAAIGSLREKGVPFIGTKGFQELLYGFAQESGLPSDRHTLYMLRMLAHIDPCLTLVPGEEKYKVRRADPRPAAKAPVEAKTETRKAPKKAWRSPAASVATVATKAQVDIPPHQTPPLAENSPQETASEEALAAQAAARSIELMKQLGQDRITEIHKAVDYVTERYVDEATTTVLLDRLMSYAESALTSKQGGQLSTEEREYLYGAFTHHERFEPIEDRPGVLRVRAAAGSTGIIRGVEVADPARFHTITYIRKR